MFRWLKEKKDSGFGINKKYEQKDDNISDIFRSSDEGKVSKQTYFFGEERKTVLDIIAPDGVNPIPLPYMTLQDSGIEMYYAGLYIDKLPRRSVIASTFARCLNSENVTSNIIMDPLIGESITLINKRINMLDTERYGAERGEDPVRIRIINGKYQEAERWAKKIDSDESTLYEVYFLFLIYGCSIEELQLRVSDFLGAAKNIDFAACYAAHPEAFLTAAPFNQIFAVKADRLGVVSRIPIKKHILDQNYLSTIFNHTSSEYFHKNGVVFGRNIFSGLPSTFDPFDRSHFSYGMVIAGNPGYGKSATVKELDSRLIDFGVTIANIDFEPLPGDGKRGEYSVIAEMTGGANYLISNDSENQINFFEFSDEIEFNFNTREEYRTLNLEQKVINMTNSLLTMATAVTLKGQVEDYKPETYERMTHIITKAVRKIYTDRGLIEKDADSLYETESARVGAFGSGRRKKRLPQMHDFFWELLNQSAENKDRFKDDSYHLLLDIFEDRVKEMYYCPTCLKKYSRAEFLKLPKPERGERICNNHEDDGRVYYVKEIHGSKAYMDCQSSFEIDLSLPYHNFDLSQIVDLSERTLMIMVCQSYIEENFIKKNSMNPQKAKKLIVGTDEAHRLLVHESARLNQNELYRVARKRHVAPRLILHSVADFAKYKDIEDIVKLTETFFLFRHNYLDKEYIKKVTNLTDSQIETLLNLGGTEEQKRYGEICLVDVPTKQAIFLQADYLKDSEFEIVETDMEKIAQAANKGRAG